MGLEIPFNNYFKILPLTDDDYAHKINNWSCMHGKMKIIRINKITYTTRVDIRLWLVH